MKKILTAYLLLLVSCAQQGPVRLFPIPMTHGEKVESLYWPERFEFNIYREWNLFQVIGYGLKTSKQSSVEGLLQSVENDNFTDCDGERLFMDDSHGVSFECLEILRNDLEYSPENAFSANLFRRYTKRNFVVRIEESAAHYFYSGDSLFIENGDVLGHRRVENISVGGFNPAGGYEEKFNTEKETVFEFYLPLNKPVVTLVIKSDEKKLKNKKSIEMDLKKLPVESEKFKNLGRK